MEHCSALSKGEILWFATIWVNKRAFDLKKETRQKTTHAGQSHVCVWIVYNLDTWKWSIKVFGGGAGEAMWRADGRECKLHTCNHHDSDKNILRRQCACIVSVVKQWTPEMTKYRSRVPTTGGVCHQEEISYSYNYFSDHLAGQYSRQWGCEGLPPGQDCLVMHTSGSLLKPSSPVGTLKMDSGDHWTSLIPFPLWPHWINVLHGPFKLPVWLAYGGQVGRA